MGYKEGGLLGVKIWPHKRGTSHEGSHEQGASYTMLAFSIFFRHILNAALPNVMHLVFNSCIRF